MKSSCSISSDHINVSQIDFTVRVLPFEPNVKSVYPSRQRTQQKTSCPKLKLADISDCSIIQACVKKGSDEQGANCDANYTYFSISSDTSPILSKLRVPVLDVKHKSKKVSPVSSEVDSIIEGSLVFMKPESERSVASAHSEEAYERNGRLRTRNWHRNFYPLALRLPENVTSNCSLAYYNMQPECKSRPKCPAQAGITTQEIPPVVPLKLSALNAVKKPKICGYVEPVVEWKQTGEYTTACGYQVAVDHNKKSVKPIQQKLKKTDLRLKLRKAKCSNKTRKQTEVMTNVTAINKLEAINSVETKNQLKEGLENAAWILLVSLLLFAFFYRSQLDSPCVCP